MHPTRPRLTLPTRAARAAAAALVLAAWLPACRSRPDDPALAMLVRTLRRGDRLVLVRTLDAEGARIAAVVGSTAGKPELRLYEDRGDREYALALTAQQGDVFRNLALDDVDMDGRDEIVVTWEGGHLEMVEVIARGQGGTYRTIFQNAGRQVEKRYGPAGLVEFWITSRTYEEGPGQTPAYETTVYRWERDRYVEAPAR